MGKFHKDLANYMVEAVNGEVYSDQDIVKVCEEFVACTLACRELF